MQYIHVLDYYTHSRVIIKIADDVDVSEKNDDILRVNHLKNSECSWLVSDKSLLVSDKSLNDEGIADIIVKI